MSSPAQLCLLLLAFVVACVPFSEATFSDHFRQFLQRLYGNEIEANLTRLDLADRGSFGGADASPVRVYHRPLVWVHGRAGAAGNLRPNLVTYFTNRSYTYSEVYGTTYGTAQFAVPLLEDTVNCANVLQVRRLIVAVALYTNSLVDVWAGSMGSPISRKAILGGKCVDTKKQLGPPLTGLVHTWISVAGANQGDGSCVPTDIRCNNITGLVCHSEALDNTNSRVGYEAFAKRYTLYSKADDGPGYRGCPENVLISPVAGQTQGFEFENFTHAQMPSRTIGLAYNLTVDGQNGVNVTPLPLALLGYLFHLIF